MAAQTRESKEKIRATLKERANDARRCRRARDLLFMARPILEQQSEVGDPTAAFILERMAEVLTEQQAAQVFER
jgi:hypothetical protein